MREEQIIADDELGSELFACMNVICFKSEKEPLLKNLDHVPLSGGITGPCQCH